MSKRISRRTARRAALAAVCLAVVVLSGCSGAGTTVEQVKGGVPGAATRALSALVLVKSWTQMLYPPAPGLYSYHQERVLINGLAATREQGVLSDGGRYVYLRFDNGPRRGTIRWGEKSLRLWASKPEGPPGGTRTQQGQMIWSGGERLHWRKATHFEDGELCPIEYSGVAIAADGRRMTYEWLRKQTIGDTLRATLPDGSSLELQCPTHVGQESSHLPSRDEGLTGGYEFPDKSVAFRLAGNDTRWTTWEVTDEGGLGGQFSLDDTMAASGNLTDAGGRTAGLLRCTSTGAGVLDLVGAGELQVTPSAAALQFQIASWSGSAALLGATPLY